MYLPHYKWRIFFFSELTIWEIEGSLIMMLKVKHVLYGSFPENWRLWRLMDMKNISKYGSCKMQTLHYCKWGRGTYHPITSHVKEMCEIYKSDFVNYIHTYSLTQKWLKPAKRTPKTSRTKSSNTQRTENKPTDVVIHQHSRKLLMMDILCPKHVEHIRSEIK